MASSQVNKRESGGPLRETQHDNTRRQGGSVAGFRGFDTLLSEWRPGTLHLSDSRPPEECVWKKKVTFSYEIVEIAHVNTTGRSLSCWGPLPCKLSKLTFTGDWAGINWISRAKEQTTWIRKKKILLLVKCVWLYGKTSKEKGNNENCRSLCSQYSWEDKGKVAKTQH